MGSSRLWLTIGATGTASAVTVAVVIGLWGLTAWAVPAGVVAAVIGSWTGLAVDEKWKVRRAGRKVELSIDLGRIGRHEEALTAAEEAVRLYALLIQIDPRIYLHDRATTLHFLSGALSKTGRLEQALTTNREAIGIYRTLAPADPGTFLPHLAAALIELGEKLSAVGHPSKALPVHEEAVAIFQQTPPPDPDLYLAALPDALVHLATTLRELGRPEEADTVMNQLNKDHT